MKVGIKLGKVKKFGIGWCIFHRMVANNATWYRVKGQMMHYFATSVSLLYRYIFLGKCY